MSWVHTSLTGLRTFLEQHFFFFKILFVCEREQEEEQREKGQADSTLSVEPDLGLDLRTPRS